MKIPALLFLFLLCAQAVLASDTPNGGLVFSATAAKAARIGDKVAFTLKFSNESQNPVRICLLESEVFRAGQSMFRVVRASDGKVADLQPSPHPHGYVVDESDFHLIPAGKSFSSTQTLYLDPARFKAGEKYKVTWIYKNKAKKWPGGVTTLDGPTKALFGGSEIPYIWIGESEVSVEISVQK